MVLQVLTAGEYVLVLGVTASTGVGRIPERAAVTDAAAIVDRQHNVTLARKPLVDAVGPVIEVHVVVPEQHLAYGTAMHEDDRRALLTRLEPLRQEQLVVDIQAVSCLRRYRGGLDMQLRREVLQPRRCRKHILLRRHCFGARQLPQSNRLRTVPSGTLSRQRSS